MEFWKLLQFKFSMVHNPYQKELLHSIFTFWSHTWHHDSWMSTLNIVLHFMIIICLFNQSESVVCFLFFLALSLYISLSVMLHVVLLSLISNSNKLFLAISGAFIATLPFSTSYYFSSSSPPPVPPLPPHPLPPFLIPLLVWSTGGPTLDTELHKPWEHCHM